MTETKDLLVTLEDLKAVHDDHKEKLKEKVDKEDGKGLSTNDYDAAAKEKVDAIPADPKYTDTVYDDAPIKSGSAENAALHLGFYLDSDGDVCQKDDQEGKVGSEATMRKIWGALFERKTHIKAATQKEVWTPDSIATIKHISDAGLAKQFLNIGDQIIVTYTDTDGNTYEMPWDVVHIGDATLADGTIKKDAVYLQSHYATVERMEFDGQELEEATEETATEGLYYYGDDGNGYTLLTLNAGDAVPYTSYTKIVHNTVKDPTLNVLYGGYGRASHSAIRQWLNSSAAKGQWWTAQHVGDCAPYSANEFNGFLAGLPADFVSCIATVKITQALNTVTEPDITIGSESYTDKVFLPTFEQMYVAPETPSGLEYEAWDYYKQLAVDAGLKGKFMPGTSYPALVNCRLDYNMYTTWVWLSSACREASCAVWYVYSSGIVNIDGANNSNACRPACVI